MRMDDEVFIVETGSTATNLSQILGVFCLASKAKRWVHDYMHRYGGTWTQLDGLDHWNNNHRYTRIKRMIVM